MAPKTLSSKIRRSLLQGWKSDAGPSKNLNPNSDCEHVGLKAHLRDVFGVYAVDRVSHILPGRGGLIGHIGNKFAAIYPLWCTNIPLIFDGTVGKLWQSFSYFEVLFCQIILPRCDEKGEGEASKHSESVVQPASIKCFPLFESNHQIHYSFKSPEYWRVNLDVGQLHQALQASVSKIVFNCWENHSGSEMYCNCPDELCEN